MDNIQSNSQESLLKDRISSNTSPATYKLVMEKVTDIVTKYSLDMEKVCKKLLLAIDSQDKILNWFAFTGAVLGKIITEDIDNYRKNWKVYNFLPLHLAMKEKGFTGELWEKMLIDAVENHALNEFPIEIKDLVDTNHAIMDYCKENTYKEFLDYLLRSKLFKKVNIPLEQLTAEAKEDADRWNKNLADLGAI